MSGITLDLNTAKILKLVTGEEICCTLPTEQLSEKSTMLRLEQPMLIKYVPHITGLGVSDYIALVKWVGFTDDKIVAIPKNKILTICNATIPFTERYKKLIKYKTKQPLPDYIERDLTDEEYEELNAKDEEILQKTKDKLKQLVDDFNMPSKLKH
jgi:hypothetical protein